MAGFKKLGALWIWTLQKYAMLTMLVPDSGDNDHAGKHDSPFSSRKTWAQRFDSAASSSSLGLP